MFDGLLRHPSRVVLVLPVLVAAGLGACSSDADTAGPANSNKEDAAPALDDATSPDSGAACVSTRDFFARQVWPILSAKCTSCHAPGETASTGDNGAHPAAGFTLAWDSYPDFLDRNLAGLSRMVTEEIRGVPKLLVKPIGGDTHGGGALFGKDAPEYAVLKDLAARISNQVPDCPASGGSPLDAVPLLDWKSTFRKAAINLGGRLPKPEEASMADEAAFDKALTALMTEPTFFDRVKEMWNDALLTDGGDRVQTSVFQFDAVEFPFAKGGQMGRDAFCAGSADVPACIRDFDKRWSAIGRALLAEPLELIANVVRKNAPFTEVLSAPYGMANPYLAQLYGVESQFPAPSDTNVEQWQEVQIVRAKAGPFAHAGVLSTPSFLGRWVSTPTNRERARSRMTQKVFLATDILKLAQRSLDTSSLTGVANAPRNSPACTVCHSVLDPVANSFSNFSDSSSFDQDLKITAATNPHQEMLPPGLGVTMMPGAETKMLSWLGTAMGADTRFPLSVTRVAYQGIVGRPVLAYPSYGDAATFGDRFDAWNAQDHAVQGFASAFVAGKLDFKALVRAIVKSPFFRAASVPPTVPAALSAELGAGHLLTPEQLDRKIRAVTSAVYTPGGWGVGQPRPHRLLGDVRTLYGGIDSFSVTARATAASAVITSIAARTADEVACQVTAWDFTRPAAERTLFPAVELTTVPGAGDADIRKNIGLLLDRAWGGAHGPADPDVELVYGIFQGTHDELAKASPAPPFEYNCQGRWDRTKDQVYSCGTQGQPDYVAQCYTFDATLPAPAQIGEDKQFTIASWMAVLSFVFSDYQFLYE